MTAELATIKNSLVVRDHDKTWRWFDAFGDNVAKWHLDPMGKLLSTTTYAGATVTVITAGTLVGVTGAKGGAIALTPDGNDNRGIQLQTTSEGFYFANRWSAYFGIKFQMVDADQTDLHAGFIITDTDIASDGVSDGLYFRVVDQSAALTLVFEQDSVESITTLGTLADATDYTAELYYDGDAGYVYAYLNGTLAGTVAVSDANWCNDEYLGAALSQLNGENSVNTVTVYWARAIQLQEE